MIDAYIDIHTHLDVSPGSDLITVKNIRIQNGIDPEIPDGLFSIGLHPWDSAQNQIEQEDFRRVATLSNFFAIGECGLDRLRGASMDIQIELFRQHIRLAEFYRKPIIIHCVRAWQELLTIKDEMRPTTPWIIHGFNGKPELTARLEELGFYLSFGQKILNPDPSLRESLVKISPDQLFLETDDGGRSIQDIYAAAASIKKLSLNDLRIRLMKNFKYVSGIDGTS
jgi:TatD DNase family protein